MRDSKFLGPCTAPPEIADTGQNGEKHYLICSWHWDLGVMYSLTGKQIDSTALIYNTKLWTCVPQTAVRVVQTPCLSPAKVLGDQT